MVTLDVLNLIRQFFVEVYQLGDRISLISIGGVDVSLNQFLLALAIMSILLTSLLTFARSHGADVADRAEQSAHIIKDKIKNRGK